MMKVYKGEWVWILGKKHSLWEHLGYGLRAYARGLDYYRSIARGNKS